MFGSAQFRNFRTVDGGVVRGFRVLDDLDARGGPPIVLPVHIGWFFNVGSDSRKAWRLFLNQDGVWNEAGGRNVRIGRA